jgi:outer membrane protein OmpA-like peptidoglycan-associated protein
MSWGSRIAVAVAGMVSLAAAAHAAGDAPPYDWSGPYVGLNGGYAWNQGEWDNSADPNVGLAGHQFHFSAGDKDFVLGGQAGYNFQFDHFVAGVEVSGDYVNIDKSDRVPGIGDTATLRTKQNWLVSVGPRLGYAFNRVLFYGGAGVAVTHYQFSNTDTGLSGTFAPNYPSKTLIGWTAGGGTEYAITDHWIAGVDYKHYDFHVATAASPSAGPGFNVLSVKEKEDVVTARISFKFGAPPPPPPPVAAAPPPPPAPLPPAPPRQFVVYFEFDKSDLTPEGAKVVLDAAATYKQTGSARIAVTGYTDLAGTQRYNLALSKRRADTVRSALVRQGVPDGAIAEAWRGKENPAVPTPDGVREPRNRRVEIVL